jgi:electron transfer flavoprotein alpha subunit
VSAILVFAETRGGKVRAPAHEALSLARRLAGEKKVPVVTVVLGASLSGVESLGADRALVLDDARLSLYQPDLYAAAVADAVKKSDARIVLFPGTGSGRDLAPRVAARLRAGLASDCTGVSWDGEAIRARRPVYAGKAVQTVRLAGTPALLGLRPRAFAAEPAASGNTKVEPLGFDLGSVPVRARVVEVGQAESGAVDLSEAEIIVSGGRGLRGPENFHLIESLAKALGAGVGASRAVVDAGWRPHGEQVGQTGKTVSPKLYVAVGISGAIQHLAGMSSAQCIVAINKDPEAPIFKVADYGIVGDAFEIVPALTEAVRKLNAQG